MSHALSGLRVLDLTHHIAGPYCTKLLADCGADVIKIEPPGGEIGRRLGPFANDEPGLERSGLFLSLNSGKRGVVLDLRSDSGRAAFESLARDADLVVESFRPGVLGRFGLSYERLAELNPRLVVLSISNFGQTGPYRDFEASDLTLYAIGAEIHSVGSPEREPLKQHGTSMLYQSGAIAAGAALAAVRAAERDGAGQWVDVAITETHTAGVDRRSETLIGYQFTGRTTTRMGGQGTLLPGGVYPCRDGYFEFDVQIRDWSQVLAMLGEPEALKDPRYFDPATRNTPELADRFRAVVLEWLQDHTMVEAWEIGQASGVPCGPLFTIENLLADPHLRERDSWGHVEHPVLGRVTTPGPPFRLGASPWLGSRPAPLLGQHTEEILRDGWASPASESGRPRSAPPSARPLPRIEAGTHDPGLGRRDRRALPLEGVRVLDLTVVWAGPFATQILADLGAEVIKLENPHHWAGYTRGVGARPEPEAVRNMVPWYGGYPDDQPGPEPWNRCAGVVNLFRNKRSATIDLRDPRGMEVFLRLVERSDVVYENNATATMPKLGITYERLRAANPGIIFVRAPAFGFSGPYADYRALGPNVEGFIGHQLMRGYPDMDASTNTSIFPSDYMSGAHGAFAVMAALRQRDLAGENPSGQLIELPQVESAIPMFTEAIMDWVLNGRLHRPIGNRDIHGAAPSGVYPSAGDDQWLALTVCDDADWPALCRLLERPDLANDATLATAGGRMRRHDELDAAIGAWTAKHDRRWLFESLQAAGIPAAPVLDAREAWDDPQLVERGFFERVSHPAIGDYPWPGMLYRMPGTPLSIRCTPATLGEANEYVYRELLGLGDREWEELLASGMIATSFADGVG
jgi:crotonobetainyl-CoA:carnitine CoA-transferase CaiB-like acyl-CoA transferase